MDKISIFKPYLSGAPAYVGGKSVYEVETKADKIYKLSSNENALGASPVAVEAMKNSLTELHVYPERTDAKLRRALAEYYRNELSPDHFMATPSGSEMIDLLVRAFCDDGHNNIASNPCFQPYFMFTKNAGAATRDIPLKGEGYALDVDGILSAINEQTRLIFLTSPNNPTGSYISKPALDYLVDSTPEHVIIVLDEVYHQFVDASDYTTAMPYVQDGKQVIGLNSFSKAYGLAGLRAGYGYGPKRIMNYVRQLWKPFFMNSIAHAGILGALKDSAFIERTRAHVIQERNKLYRAFDDIGIKYWQSQGNFIMVKSPIGEKDMEGRLLDYGIMVRGVSGFGADGCIRITVGTSEANNALIKALQGIYSEI